MSRGPKLFLKAFLIVLTMSSTLTHAKNTIFGTKELPLEINLIVESIQKYDPVNYAKILPVIKDIDLYARSISKEDIFMIGKVEVYKTLLKNYGEVNKTPIDGISLIKLRSAIAKSNDNFVTWFLNALLKDSMDLVANPSYKEFLLQRNNNIKVEKIEYRKLEKKAELLQFWISKVSPDAQDFPADLTNALAPKMIDALINIKNGFYLMAHESSMTPTSIKEIKESDLKFFAIRDAAVAPSKAPSEPQQQKSVEDILAPVLGTQPSDLPKPTQENWLDDENTPASLQNLPKPSNDADWLQDF